MKVAKIFNKGQSQMILLPKRFRFAGSKVVIRKEVKDVILSSVPNDNDLKKFLDMPGYPDFTIERDFAQQLQTRDSISSELP